MYGKTRPGEQVEQSPVFKAAFVNDTIDAIRAHKQNLLARGRPPQPIVNDPCIVMVTNRSEVDLGVRQTVRLGYDVTVPKNPLQPCFIAHPLQAEGNVLGVMVEAAAAGYRVGKVRIAGACLAQVEVQNVGHRYAEPVVGGFSLRSAPMGPVKLLSEFTELGLQSSWVLLGNQANSPNTVLGLAASGIGSGASGELQILSGTPGAETPSGETLEAFNHFGEVEPGARVIAAKIEENWYVLGGAGSEEEPPVPGVVQFELTAALAPGGTAAAKLVADDTPITVEDWSTGDAQFRGDVGFRGWAVPAGSSHQIVSMEAYAPRIECQLSQHMGATTAGQAAVTSVVGVGGRVPGGSVIVHDPQGLFKRALYGAKCEALLNTKLGRYELLECESQAGWVIAEVTSGVEAGLFNAELTKHGGSQQDIQEPPLNEHRELKIRLVPESGLSVKIDDYVLAIYDNKTDEYLLIKVFSDDVGKIKLTSEDTLGYLANKLDGMILGSPSSSNDLRTHWAVEGNELVSFIRASEVPGFAPSTLQALVHDGSGWRFMNITPCT